MALLAITACGSNQSTIKKPLPAAPETTQNKEVTQKQLYSKQKQYRNRGTEMKVGRYSTARLSSTPAQEDLLQVIIETKFPNNIKSVGSAIGFLLQRSGYQLAGMSKQGSDVKQLFDKSLPFAHRKIGPITLKDALLLLTGEAYWMRVDPVHRLIAFDTIKEFK